MRRAIAALLPFVVVSLSLTSPASAGPPWISAEYPANPFHNDTKGALFLVHTFHHGVSMQFPLTGVAEGLINGRRQTIPLKVERTYRDGVYAVRAERIPTGGAWAVVISMTDTETTARASLIASLGSNGEVLSVNVPHEIKNGWIVPRPATRAEIDAALHNAVALTSAARQDSRALPIGASLAGIGFLGLGVLGALTRRAVKR
jgi:hypothetical protein